MGPDRRRWSPVQVLAGVVVGMLAAGLVVPALVGTRSTTTVAADGPAGSPSAAGATAGADVDGGTTTTTAPGSGGAAGGTTAATAVGGGAGSASAAASAGATDSTPIKVGFTLFDVGGASRLGFPIGADPAQQRQAWQAMVTQVNAEGGINGRPVQPVFSTYDLTNADSQQASCLALTQDARVFAVLGGYNYPAASLCVVDSNRTLLVNNNAFSLEELYRSGRHVSIFPRSTRMMANFARRMAAAGQIKGKKIGILDDLGGDPTKSVINALVAQVESHGGDVVHQSVLSGDLASGSSRIPIEVNQMRSAGVEVVLLLASPLFGTQFVQQADSQRWQPVYAGSDWDVWYTDTGAQNMPAGFEGAYSVVTVRTGEWRVGAPVPPRAAECIRIFEQVTKTKAPERGQDFHGSILQICDTFLLFTRIARAAPTLDQASFMAAAQRVGRVETAAWGGGSLGPGKFDLNDATRIIRWHLDCKCWKPATPFEG
jgi:ABC-type branched-subunit amino acid transport system substrate-binding protein